MLHLWGIGRTNFGADLQPGNLRYDTGDRFDRKYCIPLYDGGFRSNGVEKQKKGLTKKLTFLMKLIIENEI